MKFRFPAICIALFLTLCAKAEASDNTIVIPVSFPDMELSGGEECFRSLVEASSAYLSRQFGGQREFHIDLVPAVTLSHPFRYYGENGTDRKDAKIGEAVIEACRKASAGYDFSEIENIVIVAAGPSEADGAGEDYFWPQQCNLSDYNLSLTLNGRFLDRFAVCTELGPDGEFAGIGDFCHEFCHFLGLKDLYDTDGEGSGGFAQGLGELSLMADGNRKDGGHTPPDFCCVEYDFLGTGAKTVLEKGSYRSGIGTPGAYFVLPSTREGKYHLMEYRNGSLTVIGINRSDEFAGFSDSQKRNLTAKERWEINEVNANPKYQGAEAISVKDFVPSDSLAAIDIRRDGGELLFEVLEPVVVDSFSVYQDGAAFFWSSELDKSRVSKSGIAWRQGDNDLNDVGVSSSDGKFIYTINNLKPGTDYIVEIYITTVNGQTFSRTTEIITQSFSSGMKPLMMLESDGRNPDGSYRPFAKVRLRIRNAPDAELTVWSFNGHSLTLDANGFWTIPGSGRLKAKIIGGDGSEDIVIKQIVVK